MYYSRRLLVVSGLAVSTIYLASGLCQAQTQDAGTATAGAATYVNAAPVDATLIDPTAPLGTLIAPANGTDSASVFGDPTTGRTGNPNAHSNPHFLNNGGTIPGLTTASTFGGGFAGQAGPSKGKLFKYTMLGNPPEAGGTTNFPTNIDEVSWTLLNADGSVFKVVKFDSFESLTLGSPNFQDSRYSSSSSPTQFGDAVQRAEFFQSLQPSQPWHTRLVPAVVGKTNITVPFQVNVRLSNGSIIQARSYFTGTAADGQTFILMLDLLFNFFFDNEVVNQINLGSFTTDALNVTAFPNTFLFSLNVNHPNTPGGCCVLGFHTYFLDGAVPQDRWLSIYASWISPGLFNGGVQDVTALSHEVSETMNDPFVDNATPNWQFPGQPAGSTVCQNNLETGDPVEVLPNSTFPVTLGGFTYHPQTEALLPWFGMGTSNALGGAFSYPDTTALPHAAKACGT